MNSAAVFTGTLAGLIEITCGTSAIMVIGSKFFSRS
jgi:hypothetical protein